MGQQPNLRLQEDEKPAQKLGRSPERRWSPSRPGEVLTPEAVPTGGSFGRPGPDSGWGMRLIRASNFDRGGRSNEVEILLGALVSARASGAGRGPIAEDVEAALSLVGLHETSGGAEKAVKVLAERRTRWMDAMAHEPWPGRSALDAVPPDLLQDRPDRIRSRLAADPALVG